MSDQNTNDPSAVADDRLHAAEAKPDLDPTQGVSAGDSAESVAPVEDKSNAKKKKKKKKKKEGKSESTDTGGAGDVADDTETPTESDVGNDAGSMPGEAKEGRIRRHTSDLTTQEVATSADSVETKRRSQDSPMANPRKEEESLEEWQTVYNKLHLREPVVTVREPTASQIAQDVPTTEVEPVPHKQSATTREVHMLAERFTSFQETQESQMQKLVFQLQEQLKRSQEEQQQNIEELVTAQVTARMKGVSNLQRMEENTNAAVGRVEMMELMMLKREMAAELPHLRTMKSTVLGLNDRVKALEEKQNLMKQNLEISMQAMRIELVEAAQAQQETLQNLQKQQDNDIRALSQVLTVTNNVNAESTGRVQRSLQAHEAALKRHIARNEERWAKMVANLHEEVETMREHMRGSMRAMVLDIGHVRQKVEDVDHSAAELNHKLVTGGGGVDVEHVAKTQVDAMKRNLGNNIMAVSDSLSFLQQQVQHLEEEAHEADTGHAARIDGVAAQVEALVQRLDALEGKAPASGPPALAVPAPAAES
uniref:Uncharacterized protein n=1 Tax=Pyramimonas obovata TaxID=1411642 RepID=A0A7S0MQ14_9CHLO|mmetsp:Transcript_10766/g.22420  ORF Transcript_10766/g.22420 Transcript_10766/m.22420 type:complete len:537 (+) Transcript_10766:152-1762(+)